MCTAKLDKFMVDILLPLAASTGALILVNAIAGECALTDALSRAYRLQKAKWGAKPPFVILSVLDDLPMLYLNQDTESYWRSLQRKVKAWKSRDGIIRDTLSVHGIDHFRPDDKALDWKGYDLDKDATTFLIVDQVSTNNEGFDSNPINALNVEIMRFLSNTVPSLALKSCWAKKSTHNNTCGYQVCLDQANSGTKLLLIDLRDRTPIVDQPGSEEGSAMRAKPNLTRQITRGRKHKRSIFRFSKPHTMDSTVDLGDVMDGPKSILRSQSPGCGLVKQPCLLSQA